MTSTAGSAIAFLPLQEVHIPLLRQWLKEPHVSEFWQETEDEAEFRQKFLNQLPERGVFPFIISLESTPIGYIQYYEARKVGGGWWPTAKEGTFGIDQFIGEPTFIGRGFGTRIIRQFMQELFQKPNVVEIITDPEPRNKRAIRAYEKAGFRSVGEIETPGGKALLMRAARSDSESEKDSFEKFQIRPIEETSAAEIELVASRMRETLMEVLGAEEGSSMYSMDWLKQRVMFHLDPALSTAKVYVAENESGFIAGHTIVRVEKDETGNRFGLFSTTFVAPEFRGQGIATQLLKTGENWMMDQGLTEATTYTSESNTKLISLYDRHGYKITATYPKKKMIRLHKSLSARANGN